MRLAIPMLLLADCSLINSPATPYRSSDCDTKPVLDAQFDVTISGTDVVTKAVVEASRNTGWVEDSGKSGMTRCATEKIVGQKLAVQLPGGKATILTPVAAIAGRYEGTVKGYGTDFVLTLDDSTGAHTVRHQPTPPMLTPTIEDTALGVVVRWTPSKDPKIGESVSVILPDGVNQMWDRSKMPNTNSSEVVPHSLFAQSGRYRIVVTRLSNDGSVAVVGFGVERVVP